MAQAVDERQNGTTHKQDAGEHGIGKQSHQSDGSLSCARSASEEDCTTSHLLHLDHVYCDAGSLVEYRGNRRRRQKHEQLATQLWVHTVCINYRRNCFKLGMIKDTRVCLCMGHGSSKHAEKARSGRQAGSTAKILQSETLMTRVHDSNDKWRCIKDITSRAFSCPMKPAATGSASPASLSPRPLTWLWEAIRSVLVVDLTSSIFMMSYVQTWLSQQHTRVVVCLS
jgi:hypothetical protein